MNRISRLLLVAAMLGAATVAHAGTAHVFCQKLGNLASPTEAQQSEYASFLASNNIDFGFFYGPTSAANFGLTAEGYTSTLEYVSDTTGGGRVLVYNPSVWRVASHDSPQNVGSSKYPNWCERYVLERLSNGEQFAVVLFTGKRFDKGSYLTYGSYLANTSTLYPGAWVLVALPYNGALYTSSYSSMVASNLSGSSGNYTRAPDVSGTGAVFAKKHDTLSISGASVSLSFGSEPAAAATVTYQRSLTVSFEDWDGTGLKTETVLEGGNATPPSDPSRTGYTFTGWSGSNQNVQTDITLTAQYDINTYTVRFLDYNGTTVLKSETVAYGSDATPPADPTREGYRFIGWQGNYTGITGPTDITAEYVEASAVTHWVTFFDWDGTQLSRQEILEGEDATPPADPDNRAGWHFTSWQGTYTNVQQDETVTAQYAINTYSVTFQDWDETVLKTETVNHGSDATPPADPSREGWHFTGWSGTYQNVQSATTITAQYEIDTFTVTFQYTNGVVIATQTVPYQGSATKPANPAPLEEGTVFYHWEGSYSSVTADTTVTAIFVPTVIEIGTGAEFGEYIQSDLMGMSSITLALTNDISMSGVSYSRRSLFATIDGRGHTVSNLPSSFKLFSDLRGGTIRDIRFLGFRSPGNANRTSIIASSSYTGTTLSGVVLEDCHWTVPTGSYGTSAFIYQVSQSTLMTNCVMRNCSVLGVNAGGGEQYIGGFVAIASSLRLVDCHFIVDDTNTVAVGDGIHVAGAFIGKCGSAVTFEQCSNNARVTVAKSAGATGGAGGFVGIATSSGSPTITGCANFGSVASTVAAYPAGGIVGDAGSESGTFSMSIFDTFNYGAVSSPIAAGGLVGRYRGVVSALRNDGNSGAVSSAAGAAGGFVGIVRYNDADRTWRIRNAMQAGSVSTETGFAGILVGGIEASDFAGLTMSVSNTVMAGSAAVTDGGQVGLLIGGRDTAENEMAFAVDDTCRVLASNASLTHYYDKDNAPASLATAPDTITASALVDNNAKRRLNAVATANGWMPWVQGHDYPELSLFGEKHEPGLILVFY